MSVSTPQSIARQTELQKDLTWLQAEHPEKKALIALAQSVLTTHKQASSCSSFVYPPQIDSIAELD